MAEWRVPIDHLLEFAGEEERQFYLSPERTEAERTRIRAELEEVYQSIPDPTEAELRQFTGENTWSETQHNPSARDLPKAQWKGFRKAKAREDLAAQPSPPEPEKPVKKGTDLYDLIKRMEQNPPSAEETAKTRESLEKIVRSFMDQDEAARERSKKLLESLTSQSDLLGLSKNLLSDPELSEYFAKHKEPPEPPPAEEPFDPRSESWLQVHQTPDGPELRRHLSEAEERARRKAEIEEQSKTMENAFYRALQRTEDRKYRDRQMDAWTKSLGYTPIDEMPTANVLPQSQRWFSRKAVRTFVGAAVIVAGLVAAALAEAGVLTMGWAHLFLFFAWIVSVAGVCVGEGFEEKNAQEIIRLGCVTALVSGVVLFGVDRLIANQKMEQERSVIINPSPQPSATLFPSPLVANAESEKQNRIIFKNRLLEVSKDIMEFLGTRTHETPDRADPNVSEAEIKKSNDYDAETLRLYTVRFYPQVTALVSELKAKGQNVDSGRSQMMRLPPQSVAGIQEVAGFLADAAGKQ